MADQTYNLTQTGAEVQAIINDAEGVKGAGATTSLTTDYIMLKDTSGNYHKIQKSSFTEAVRNTLASLLVNNDKGTTINQIPAIASGDFGSVTPANLASVLGGISPTDLTSSDNIENLSAGFYRITNERPQGFPESVTLFGYLLIRGSVNRKQVVYTNTAGEIVIAHAYPGSSGGNINRWTKFTGTIIQQ